MPASVSPPQPPAGTNVHQCRGEQTPASIAWTPGLCPPSPLGAGQPSPITPPLPGTEEAREGNFPTQEFQETKVSVAKRLFSLSV